MASSSSPIDIDRPLRNGSVSPHYPQTSNLTSALQSTSGNELRSTPAMNIGGGNPKGFGHGSGRRDSMGGGNSAVYSGAQPISMDNSGRKTARRESIASSVVGGMSWGGVSVGSWIRDEYGVDRFICRDGSLSSLASSCKAPRPLPTKPLRFTPHPTSPRWKRTLCEISPAAV